MEFPLDRDDALLLQRILTGYLSDLRMEIVDTDRSTFKDQLKAERDQLKVILSRLERLTGEQALT